MPGVFLKKTFDSRVSRDSNRGVAGAPSQSSEELPHNFATPDAKGRLPFNLAMKHNLILSSTLSACILAACVPTINLPLDHAKLADGYINSSSLDFGHVLVWNTKTDRVAKIYRIKPSDVPSATVDSGPRYDIKESSVSAETAIEVKGALVSDDAVIEAKSQFLDSTDVTLTNYNPREYRDARYTLNSPELRSWRESLSEEYTDPHWRFIFISRVTDADELHISRLASGESGSEANVVQAGRYAFRVTYGNKRSNSIKSGGEAPLMIEASVFTFRVHDTSYRFFRDLDSPFNFQTATKG
jgi:hypothetical protein